MDARGQIHNYIWKPKSYRGTWLPSGLGENLATGELDLKYIWETEPRQLTFKQFIGELLLELFPSFKDPYFSYKAAGGNTITVFT